MDTKNDNWYRCYKCLGICNTIPICDIWLWIHLKYNEPLSTNSGSFTTNPAGWFLLQRCGNRVGWATIKHIFPKNPDPSRIGLRVPIPSRTSSEPNHLPISLGGSILLFWGKGNFQGPSNPHTTPIRIPASMGSLWEGSPSSRGL